MSQLEDLPEPVALPDGERDDLIKELMIL